MHDPRNGLRVSERDIRALTFIGEGYEVAQYQLHAAIFPNVSAVVVSHFVTRAVRNGWIAVERWNRVGINRLRLTARGRQVAVRAGGDPVALFVPKKAVASKDVAHTLWINDVRVALGMIAPPFDAILPAWQLQRRFVPPPAAIPDVLALRGERDDSAPLVFAFEIDLGGERLAKTFLPKLRTLHRLVQEWSNDSALATTLVLTTTANRAEAINSIAISEQLPLMAATISATAGPEGAKFVAGIMAAVLRQGVR
jgi:hypothetical protein